MRRQLHKHDRKNLQCSVFCLFVIQCISDSPLYNVANHSKNNIAYNVTAARTTKFVQIIEVQNIQHANMDTMGCNNIN